MFSISMHALKVYIQNLLYFLVQLCFPQRLTSPDQAFPSRALPPRPKLCCMIKIGILFLEICDSFSEIRRDLCSSYFYCKSNSLDKNNVICKKVLFLLQRLTYRAEGAGGGEAYLMNLSDMSRARFCPILFTCGVSGFLDTKLLLSVGCPQFLFSCTQKAQRQRGSARWEREGVGVGRSCEENVFIVMETFVVLSKEPLVQPVFLAFVNDQVGFQVRQSSLAS